MASPEPLKPFSSAPVPPPSPPTGKRTRIAIVGGGSAGLGALLGLLDLPESVKDGWDIALYESRADVGGVWLPDPTPPPPPHLPASPLYPLLKTNTPVPTMTFPNLPFAPGTPLYPQHQHVESYHQSVVKRQKLAPYIYFSSEITKASWNHRTEAWDLVVRSTNSGESKKQETDHLIVANGHYHHPKSPKWKGVEGWEAEGNTGDRVVKHSLWYRGSEDLVGRVAVVVGFGASGWDIARQALEFADEVYHSFDPQTESTSPKLPPIHGTIVKPRISHFTPESIHFVDGSTLSAAKVTIYLATGYKLLAPFLTSDLIVTHHSAPPPAKKLSTNERYIRPLHLDLFSAGDADIPVNRLAFIGISYFVAAAANAYAQGLYVGHAIAQKDFLPNHEDVLKEVEDREKGVRKAGFDPFKIGHKFTAPGDAEAYQNHFISLIRQRSQIALPPYLSNPKDDFVEKWRVDWRAKGLKLGSTWLKAVEKGVAGQKRFTSETGTEEDWVRAMEALEAWGEEEAVVDSSLSV
ncbi:hypothetical protein P7C70_g6043, partial [Phenoliferia sp. Uapishka_3]